MKLEGRDDIIPDKSLFRVAYASLCFITKFERNNTNIIVTHNLKAIQY